MGQKKLTVYLQEEVFKIPNNLTKYNLKIREDNISLDYTYNVQAKQTGITNLLQDLKDEGLKLRDLKTEQNSLEKIFVSLVKDNNEI
jgi:ABC-2 type transport system ATP-binding protein